MKSTTVVCIPKNVCEEVDGFLSGSSEVPDAGDSEVLLTVSTEVLGPREGLEVDIKVINSESGPYVDAVLFENGSEVYALEPSFEHIRGEYLFELDGEEILVEIVAR
jgi:hypothetical protein